jgi:hypothetical protein
VIFATASAAALSGASTIWPTEALSRPLADPFIVSFDDSNYLIDPNFDYSAVQFPTRREFYDLEGLSGEKLRSEIGRRFDEFDWLVEDTNDWSLSEIEPWLDEEVDIEELGEYQSTFYGEYGAGLRIYENLSGKQADELDLELVEGDHPGSSFTGVAFYGDVDELNRKLESEGLNMIVVPA